MSLGSILGIGSPLKISIANGSKLVSIEALLHDGELLLCRLSV